MYYLYCREANSNQCSTKLTEKQPCRHLQECPPKRYGNTFNPFPNGNDNNNEQQWNSYTNTWEQRGIESGTLGCYKQSPRKSGRVILMYISNIP